MRLVIIVLAITCIFSPPVNAENLYVLPSGTCGNNGNGASAECPESPGSAGAFDGFSNIQWGDGAGKVSAGDTLSLVAGHTYNEMLSIGASGSEGSPVTISVTGTGQAVIDGGGVRTGIRISAYSYITIDGVAGNAVVGERNYGLKIQNPGVDNWIIYSYDDPDHIIITHIEGYGTLTGASDDSKGGILLANDGTDIEISYCWIHGPAKAYENRAEMWDATGICVWSPLSGTGYTNIKLHHNKIEYLYRDGIRGGNNISIYNNDVSWVHGSGHSDSILCQSGSYCAIHSNYVHNSSDQNIYIDNLLNSTLVGYRVYNNVVNSPGGFGVVLDPEGGASSVLDDVLIANNTFYSTAAECIRSPNRGAVTGLQIKNNIFGPVTNDNTPQISKNSSWTFADDNAFDHNAYMTGSVLSPDVVNWEGDRKTLAELQALTPARETNGKVGDPSFVSVPGGDFRLVTSDTVAKDSGVSMSTYFITDKGGIARVQGTSIDIGAHEFIPDSAGVLMNKTFMGKTFSGQ